MHDNIRPALLCGLVLSSLSFPLLAQTDSASGYPARPITIIVPYQAGGGADTIARLVSKNLSQHLNGQTIIVDNRAGANGDIGSAYVARSAADGYTLLINNNTISINAALGMSRGYNLSKDLLPVTQLVSSPVAIGIGTGVSATNLEELLAFVRANPKEASYASCGNGSPQHLSGAAFNQQAGTDLVHVPFNGCAPAVTAGVGNQVPIVFSTIPNLAPHVAANKAKVLAVTSKQRLSFMPNIPAMAEHPLFKNMDLTVWFGLFAPAKTPPAIIKRIEQASLKVLEDPSFRKELNARYYEIDARGADAFTQQVQQDLKVYSELVKSAKISLE